MTEEYGRSMLKRFIFELITVGVILYSVVCFGAFEVNTLPPVYVRAVIFGLFVTILVLIYSIFCSLELLRGNMVERNARRLCFIYGTVSLWYTAPLLLTGVLEIFVDDNYLSFMSLSKMAIFLVAGFAVHYLNKKPASLLTDLIAPENRS